MKPDQVILRRNLSAPRTSIQTVLQKGVITLLTDADGGNLQAYLPYLKSGKGDAVTMETGGKAIAEELIFRVGFFDEFPENSGINSFLRGIGVPQDSISAVMDAYDLSRVSYLSCSQLPAVAQRQLSMLAALRSRCPILILQDPFQPFSGRWREQFAEELLENVVTGERCALIVNLSFYPQCWTERPQVVSLDLQKRTDEAIERAIGIEREEKERKLREERAAAAHQKARPAQAAPAAGQATQNGQGTQPGDQPPELIMPEHFAYRHVRDFIFEPAARVSRMLRTWSGALAASCVTILVACMAYVFVPAILGSDNGYSQFAASWREGAEQIEPALPQGPDGAGDEELPIPVDGLIDQAKLEDSLETGLQGAAPPEEAPDQAWEPNIITQVSQDLNKEAYLAWNSPSQPAESAWIENLIQLQIDWNDQFSTSNEILPADPACKF